MANSLNTNPIYLDTFAADVVIRTGTVIIEDVYFETNLNNDVLVLKDAAGNVVYRKPATAESVDAGVSYDQPNGSWDGPSGQIRCDGLVLDVSEGNYDGTCFALIMV